MDTRLPLLIAHRGGAPEEIENSAAAFEHACATKVDVLECDVRQTADGALVLIHDAAVRLGTRRVAVRRATLQELQDALPWLLTFSEFLERFGRRARLVVDLKDSGYEREVREALARGDALEQSLISTVHAYSLRRLARGHPRPQLGLSRGHLVTSMPTGIGREAAALWLRLTLPPLLLATLRFAVADTAVLQYRIITPGLVRRLHQRGYRVSTWTVDDEAEARRLHNAGVDAIASNDPLRIRQALAS